MHALFALAAPVTLMLPLIGGAADMSDVPTEDRAPPSARQCDAASEGLLLGLNPLVALRKGSVANQVRIEQRVLIRIAPAPSSVRQNLTADLPQRPLSPRFEERSKEKCVGLEGIAGVQTGSGNRLVLFLRDQRMLSVNLEKACRARDFYAGFYVEKNRDGRLCVSRDKLQSRNGARCEIDTMRHLVEVRG